MDQCWYSEYKLEFIGEVKQKNKPMKKYIWAKDTPFAKKGDTQIGLTEREIECLIAGGWIEEGWIEEAGPWKPEMGEDYWVIVLDYVETTRESIWENDRVDGNRFSIGNYFKTKEEAAAAAEKVKALLLSLHV